MTITTGIRLWVVGTALVLAAACTRPDGQAADAGAASTASAIPVVDRAVVVARALRADPAATDSILTAHGLTRTAFDSLLYEIAADPAMARAYAEALQGP